MTLSASAFSSDSAEAPCSIFQREGWLLVPRLIDRAKVDALLAATCELERVAAHFERDTHVRRVFFQMQSASGKKGEAAIFPGALRKITSPSSGQPEVPSARTSLRLPRRVTTAQTRKAAGSVRWPPSGVLPFVQPASLHRQCPGKSVDGVAGGAYHRT